jgi:leucyl/phenylalanyl-tRNA--protein transferase
MPVFSLNKRQLIFPNPKLASVEGLLAIGGDLSPQRLLLAYQMGIFPWFNEGDPILWWSPDPRFVLFPHELKIAKSMRPYFNQRKFSITLDRDFSAVIDECARQPRQRQSGGTWITDGMREAYQQLHELGYAHSAEVWLGQDLVGGLYGIALGKVFFGESMFAKLSNASKVGFIVLVRLLRTLGFWLIDCQQETRHLESLGARNLDRTDFLHLLAKNKAEPTIRGKWTDLENQMQRAAFEK